MGSQSLLLGIFLTQGLNLGFPHCSQILYHLGHQRSPKNHIQGASHRQRWVNKQASFDLSHNSEGCTISRAGSGPSVLGCAAQRQDLTQEQDPLAQELPLTLTETIRGAGQIRGKGEQAFITHDR